MKNTACCLFLSAVFLFGLLFIEAGTAQDNEEPQMYARSFYIQRIYPHRSGYRIIYMNDTGRIHELYAPLDWFGRSQGNRQIAEMRHGRNPAYPYMEIFWKDGEFSHMRIFARQDYSHESWGIWLNVPDNVDELFDVDEPQFNL